jgi:hypothetical protein
MAGHKRLNLKVIERTPFCIGKRADYLSLAANLQILTGLPQQNSKRANREITIAHQRVESPIMRPSRISMRRGKECANS